MNNSKPAVDIDVDADLAAIEDVFATAPDFTEPTARDVRSSLILSSKRRLVPMRRSAVQLPRKTNGSRRGTVFSLVSDRMHLPFDLWLQALCLQPVISDKDPLDGAAWANLLSVDRTPRTAAAISRSWSVLEAYNLVDRSGKRPKLLREDGVLRDDGSKEIWSHPGEVRDAIGYFGIPRAYWLDGHADALSLPAKGMLLLLLAETNEPTSGPVKLTHEQFSDYYGISISSVKRGLDELRNADLLAYRDEKVVAPRSAAGFTWVKYYWLKGKFSSAARERARELDLAEISSRQNDEAPDD